MINFEDFNVSRKGWTAKRKAVEAGTNQDILMCSFLHCLPLSARDQRMRRREFIAGLGGRLCGRSRRGRSSPTDCGASA
jgi:hypothetical protein